MEEHKVILQGLGVLKVVTGKIEKRQSVDLRDLRFLVRFFRVYADNIHHHAEEEILFDGLVEIAPRSLKRMMEQLITQHFMGRLLVQRIADSVAASQTGLRGWRTRFVGSAQAYDTLLSCHICSEDHHVFPIIDKVLSKRGVRGSADHHLSLGVKKGLERSLQRLVYKYGVGDTEFLGGRCERG